MKVKEDNKSKGESRLHPRNKLRGRYDFKELTAACPTLLPFVKVNEYGTETIDFFNPQAVIMLNTALLKFHYDIDAWNIPSNYLCPPIPGRADYIHHIADLLQIFNYGKIPLGEKVKVFDIGVGANCVYPIVGVKEYGWSFIGSEIDAIALESAHQILESNPSIKDKIDLRLQAHSQDIFKGIIETNELFDIAICNPPFHGSLEEALEATSRKLRNLKKEKNPQIVLNFGGQSNELWCEGGEDQFISNMIAESKQYANSCFWFTSLVSKKTNLTKIYHHFDHAKVFDYKTVSIGTGNKSSRIVAWTFLDKIQQKSWVNSRWNAKAKAK